MNVQTGQPRLAALLATIPGFVWTADAAGEIQYVNPRFVAFVGRPEASFKKGFWSEFIHGDDLQGVISVWAQANAKLETYRTDARFRRSDGVWRWLRLQAEPELSEDHTLLGWYGFAEDVHPHKELADALSASEARQREAAERLSEANRLKDEFLATLAHELRNPLAPIQQAALVSGSAASSPEQKKYSHDIIDRQVNHMSLLLDDLLDISRVTRGALTLRVELVRLSEIIDLAIETAQPTIDAKRHALNINVPATITLTADRMRLAQVVVNLLTNAAKYTDPGGTISLIASCDDEMVNITVRDTGIGLSPHALEGIFEMFSQVAAHLRRSEGGLGIGLALSKGLVELHKGKIEARSPGLGHGSEFIVSLPIEVSPNSCEQMSKVHVEHTPAHRSILIADDNQDAAESLAMLLRLEGHQVQLVNDGWAAVAACLESRPQVAILDIGMPVLNGYEVARAIRRGRRVKDITLIAMTGWGQDEDKVRAFEAGFDHHFTKPVDVAALRELLNSSLEHR